MFDFIIDDFNKRYTYLSPLINDKQQRISNPIRSKIYKFDGINDSSLLLKFKLMCHISAEKQDYLQFTEQPL